MDASWFPEIALRHLRLQHKGGRRVKGCITQWGPVLLVLLCCIKVMVRASNGCHSCVCMHFPAITVAQMRHFVMERRGRGENESNRRGKA